MNLCIIIFIFMMAVLESSGKTIPRTDYWAKRKQFIQHEKSLELGSEIVLTPKEEMVNKVLMTYKSQELDNAFKNQEAFPPARHFFEARDDIEKSNVFLIISSMPKGGALHVHDTAISSAEYVVYNISYREHLYVCKNEDVDKTTYIFANPAPVDEYCISMSELRTSSKDVQEFDKELLKKFTLFTENPNEKYPDINTVWSIFQNIFGHQESMLTYAQAFTDYMYNALEEFYRDNVNYIEIRGVLPALYELDGTTHGPVKVMGMVHSVAQDFMKNHPDFLGIKYIYAPFRGVDTETMDLYLSTFLELKTLYPDFLVGFDLVGQEDKFNPLVNFVDQLRAVSNQVKFFFHAAETNWNGLTDMNAIDAILLNTTRIGHGFGVIKHPLVMSEIKKRDIAIEVNPISNQVLALVKDLRNHPASVLFAQNYPVVISSDDPGLWGAKGLSYDFYEAFMGIASSTADLRCLKKLALNSITYSSMESEEKEIAKLKFENIWNKFIDQATNPSNFYM